MITLIYTLGCPMKPSISLGSRNQFVLTLFICSFAIVGIIFVFNFFNHIGSFPFVPAIAIVIMVIIFFTVQSDKVVMWANVLLMNGAVFLQAYIDLKILAIMWLLFITFLASLYFLSSVTNIVLCLTVLELTLLSRVNMSVVLSTPVVLFALLFIVSIALLQGAFLTKTRLQYAKLKTQREYEQQSRDMYLNMFFEQANDAIAVVDLHSRVLDMNPAFEKLYGWSRDECIGKVIPFIPPENFKAANSRLAQLHNGENISLETIDMRKDGTRIHVQLSMSPIYNADGRMLAISLISQDITYRKEAERRLLQSEKLAAAGEIAAGVAHEIRNPLTAISGFVQMMNQDEDSPYYTYTQIMQSELERINLIIGEFLVLSKPHVENTKDLSITNVCLTIATFLQFEFQSKNISFEQHIPNENYIIHADENQIKQVIINILRNSIEAVEQDGRISLHLYTTSPSDITIEVRDNGSGMNQEVLSKIFDPFFTTKEDGTGLGMMLTKRIIESYAGHIDIESISQQGTSIFITFPLVQQ